ncbi:MAG: hypothetical protein JKY20_11925 [Alphaproteobacteria bacterium]|nr:hypothetical protein [Alphaproteobacteria bacterium]
MKFSPLTAMFALSLIILSGCYLPSNYEADFNISKNGDFAFRYTGNITSIPLLSKIGKGELSREQIEESIAIYKRDLERDSSFEKVQYVTEGRYKVKYEYRENILKSKSFTFIRSNAHFLRLMRRKDGYTEIQGNRPPKKYIDELISKGFDSRGVLRVWTDAKVLKHNAQLVKKGPKTVYVWALNSMRDPLPSMILLLK